MREDREKLNTDLNAASNIARRVGYRVTISKKIELQGNP